MTDVSPCLWFDHQAYEAANFYVQTFRQCGKQATIDAITHYPPDHEHLAGKVLTVSFTLSDQRMMGLNGGTYFKLSPAISFFISCRDQPQLDQFWEILSDGGEVMQCGWLTDKYGLSWQVIPDMLNEIMTGKDAAKMNRVMTALMPMIKLDIATLEKARDAV